MTSCRVATKASRRDCWAEEKVTAAAVALRFLGNGAGYSPIKRKISPHQNHPPLPLIKVRRDRQTRKMFHRKKELPRRRRSPRLAALQPAADEPPRTHPFPRRLRPSLRMKQEDGTITQRSSSPKMGKYTWHTVGGAWERGERRDGIGGRAYTVVSGSGTMHACASVACIHWLLLSSKTMPFFGRGWRESPRLAHQ